MYGKDLLPSYGKMTNFLCSHYYDNSPRSTFYPLNGRFSSLHNVDEMVNECQSPLEAIHKPVSFENRFDWLCVMVSYILNTTKCFSLF